jgi:hypothetical protein
LIYAAKKETSTLTKKTTVVLFGFFLLLFSRYTPYAQTTVTDGSFLKTLFSFYFFAANQTLGIVHEGGHGICYILHCPKFITAANGTIFQLLFPTIIAYYYKKRGDNFAALIAFFFTGFSLHYTAWYISTAHEGLYVPAAKSFLGVDGYHDFNYILSSLGLLAYDNIISILTRFGAYAIMIYSVFMMFVDAYGENSGKKI